MKIQRFFGNFDFSQKNITVEDDGFYNQIKNVLRLKAGGKIILCDGKANDAECTISSIGDKGVLLKVDEVFRNENESQLKLTAYCSILKRENFELIAQKLTELGVFKIVPIICKNTIKQSLKKERLEVIIREAAEQSGRGIIPELSEAKDFKEVVKSAKKNGPVIIFDLSGEEDNLSNNTQNISMFIGPEGGWDKSEIDFAKKNELKIFSLGKLTLRAETAAIVGSFLALNIKNL
jgi:16S rRNA (uracil1498-N3)-methyltransferase